MTSSTEPEVLAKDSKQADQNERPTSQNGPSSDGESERTREKLKKTSIAGLSQHSQDNTTTTHDKESIPESVTGDAPPAENGNIRGRPSKKRSFEDVKDEQPSPAETAEAKRRTAHKRMRSREVTYDDDELVPAYNGANAGSPVQEESDVDVNDDTLGGPGVMVDVDVPSDPNAQTAPTVEEKVLEEDDTTNETTVDVASESAVPSVQAQAASNDKPAPSFGSAFANTSSASPFGATKPPTGTESKDDPTTTTTSSAFASSGLAAFASHNKSPFGAASSTQSTGGFGGGSTGFGGGSSTFGKPTSGFGSGGGFGGAAAPSSFGTSSSAFASKSAFGGSSSFAGSSGFGGGSTPKPFGGAPARFGAKPKNEDEGEDGSDDEDEQDTTEASTDEKPDSRFHQQDGRSRESASDPFTYPKAVETGEEDEETIFSARAKLYHFEKEWKERGTGVIKVNVRQEKASKPPTQDDEEQPEKDLEAGDEEDEAGELKARVIMRSDGVHRVILNSPVFKDMSVGDTDGKEPTNTKTMFLTGMDDGKPRLFQIKVCLLSASPFT